MGNNPILKDQKEFYCDEYNQCNSWNPKSDMFRFLCRVRNLLISQSEQFPQGVPYLVRFNNFLKKHKCPPVPRRNFICYQIPRGECLSEATPSQITWDLYKSFIVPPGGQTRPQETWLLDNPKMEKILQKYPTGWQTHWEDYRNRILGNNR